LNLERTRKEASLKDEKAFGAQKGSRQPLSEELSETSMRSSEIPASTEPPETFTVTLSPAIAKQQMHSPSMLPNLINYY
jgi:hypothetical protein